MSKKSKKLSLRFQVLKRDNNTCVYCGSKPPDAVLEVDHINPRSKGGATDLSNLVTSCFKCNRGKRDKLITDTPEKPNKFDKISSEELQYRFHHGPPLSKEEWAELAESNRRRAARLPKKLYNSIEELEALDASVLAEHFPCIRKNDLIAYEKAIAPNKRTTAEILQSIRQERLSQRENVRLANLRNESLKTPVPTPLTNNIQELFRGNLEKEREEKSG
jgi:hypothetical protein